MPQVPLASQSPGKAIIACSAHGVTGRPLGPTPVSPPRLWLLLASQGENVLFLVTNFIATIQQAQGTCPEVSEWSCPSPASGVVDGASGPAAQWKTR